MQLPPVSLGEATPPVPQTLQSPMANLMSITETLPPGSPRNGPSPPGPPPPRTASRGSQQSPNSSGKSHKQGLSELTSNREEILSKNVSRLTKMRVPELFGVTVKHILYFKQFECVVNCQITF